ncbi:hypothetical protein [Nocardia asteroides]|uniref:DUF732 domain-containing protein n=3 Tax=Nocardia TaxID=1817 RepID=U5EQQ7_NOCAS|nr:hypothetical protein [Nocardia asteroides]TLF63675.1 hypothetical protein FEK33_27230 [Nocardia asteroides NBRC 15531]UGT46863.1 hypothetical protein LT345_20275 [Nocardia asteroides]GAD87444.1 hypothetical protein NCAST_34_05730 [Nocardia asteroides NBRC 15531]
MSRTTAAIAASATVFALLLAGCGDDTSTTTAATSTSAAAAAQVDSGKAGMFVVSYRNAFPKLAEGRDDAAIGGLLTQTCGDIKAGKAEADVVAGVVKNAKNGATAPTTEEAQAIYQMAKLMC